MTAAKYSHLGFRDWPFHTVPSREFSRLWLDMDQTRNEVVRLAKSLELKGQSSINPVWGWFGMGKTHILMHLLSRWSEPDSRIVPVYTEFPVSATSFLDLYRGFMTAFLLAHRNLLVKMASHCMSSLGLEDFEPNICPQIGDFAKAMRLLVFKESTSIVEEWLKASNVLLKTLRSIGLNGRIENDTSAIAALASIVALVNRFPDKTKLVWLIDETQKMIDMRPKQRGNVQASLQSLFNQCPLGLALIPAYSGRQPDKIADILTDALLSRMGTSRRVFITPLSVSDSRAFVQQLFDAYRPEGYSGHRFFPFTETSIDFVIGAIEKEGWVLKPRNLMKLLESITEYYEPALEEGTLEVIKPEDCDLVIREIRESSDTVSSLKKME